MTACFDFSFLMISTCEGSGVGVGGLRGYQSHSEAGKRGWGETSEAVSVEWASRQIGLLDKLQTIKACR